MKLKRFMGLCIAKCDTDEALEGSWRSVEDDIDVVRVSDPPPDRWGELRAAGFVCKPRVVRWYAPTTDGDTGYRARMSRKERWNLRQAERAAEQAGLAVEVVRRIGPALMDEFLTVYRERVAEQRRGLDVAGGQREQILADDSTVAVVARTPDGELAGMIIGRESPGDQALRISVSAVTEHWRRASLARVMYARAAEAARDLGRPYLTAGADPNLFGLIAEPGLYSFKVRLGFTPTAPQLHVPGDRWDEADLVLSLGRLGDPSLIVGYRSGGGTADLDLHVFGTDPGADLRPYRPGLPGTPVFHRIGGGAP